jgi:Arm DNA-binding domain
MRSRNNPNPRQLLRRLRRRPRNEHDPRAEIDPYWVLRFQGHPHAYAKRAIREELPKVTEHEVGSVTDYDCDPEDLLFEPGTKIKTVEVEHIRPPLTEEIIPSLQPRESEYTVWDHEVPGLGLRIRASGHKSFILLYRVPAHSKLKKITIGKAGYFTLKKARQLAGELLSDERLNRLRVRISRQYRPLWDKEDDEL